MSAVQKDLKTDSMLKELKSNFSLKKFLRYFLYILPVPPKVGQVVSITSAECFL